MDHQKLDIKEKTRQSDSEIPNSWPFKKERN